MISASEARENTKSYSVSGRHVLLERVSTAILSASVDGWSSCYVLNDIENKTLFKSPSTEQIKETLSGNWRFACDEIERSGYTISFEPKKDSNSSTSFSLHVSWRDRDKVKQCE